MSCKNLIGTYMCICSPGYTRQPSGDGCMGKSLTHIHTHCVQPLKGTHQSNIEDLDELNISVKGFY